MPPPRARMSGSIGAGGTLAMRQQQQQQQQQQQARASKPKQPQQPELMYNTANWKNNFQVVYYLRIYMTIVAGVVAGILGITGWQGSVVYFISQALCTPMILIKAGGGYKKYFPSWDKVVLEHVFSSTAILSYVLCWMIGYNLGYVF